MEFLKKHYEKVILAIVLVAFLGGSVALVLQLQKSQEEATSAVTAPAKKKAAATNEVSSLDAALDSVKNPKKIVLSGEHNLFNPVIWKKKPNGTLVKLDSDEKLQVKLVKINYLRYIISFEKQIGNSYYFSVTREASTKPAELKKQTKYVSLPPGNAKNEYFTLLSIQGPPEDPTGFQIEVADTKEKAMVTKTTPFSRVEGYSADLRYDLENKNFTGKRVGDVISFNEDDYKVIAITENEVRVLANSNQKQTTLKYTAPK
ncbi:MAG: hypothetical protein JWN25_3321 [Verrucomicrobiales bacterium]|nr:hypothetical protein [Verrucomicrobiales bacterium]